MQTVELKLIVETLSKCGNDFADQYEVFKEHAGMKLQDEYDKFFCGLSDCFEVLGVIIGTAEVASIRKRV
ncbi:hypothetical protein [Bacteroides sp. UBA939]|uniref:hypothetical protein n=1 Tax=Bacteroides sp. UBA939 TaxID=1946092 RepID=UPI0025C55F59|nr:hypothetical protein [Bacteroides sp. UBA939]